MDRPVHDLAYARASALIHPGAVRAGLLGSSAEQLSLGLEGLARRSRICDHRGRVLSRSLHADIRTTYLHLCRKASFTHRVVLG